jgi:nicotinate phosphoribosyltransferase
MSTLAELYRPSLFLLTDLYQLTMACAYWKSGMASHEAVFHLQFRQNPFNGGYTVAAGLQPVIELISAFRPSQEDIEYLASLKGADDEPLLDQGFLEYLHNFRFSGDIIAVPEGTVVFPQEPLVRVQGPVIECQLLETQLLNLINFSSLIATKAARVCEAARGQSVVEFGLRRAQGIDGGITASRAAYIGGCAGTSNVLAGKLFGIPVKGTHAHSWVMCFDSELDAFKSYAEALPNNCIFLVDTYDTLDGVRNAIEAARWLKEQGKPFLGIRLDSGDLAYLSKEARKLLDEAGFPEARILASNDLDEYTIRSLREQNAEIALWGVGTRLVTAHDQPALGGVYKLSAIRAPGEQWKPRVKLSEQLAKITTPGRLQVRRFLRNGSAIGDATHEEEMLPDKHWTIVDPLDATRRKRVPQDAQYEELLVPVFKAGELVYVAPTLQDIRRRVRDQLSLFHESIHRFENPHEYPAGLELGLHERKTELILKARGLR